LQETSGIHKQVTRVFAIAAILAAALIIFTGVNFNVSRKLMLDFYRNEGVNTAFSLEGAARAAGVENARNLEMIIKGYQNKEHIAYMAVLNRDGTVVAGFDKGAAGKMATGQSGTGQKGAGPVQDASDAGKVSMVRQTSDEGRIYEVTLPLHLGRLERDGNSLSEEHTGREALGKTGEGNYLFLVVGISSGLGERLIQPAVIQLALVIIMVTILGILGVFQYRTLKKYLALQETNSRNQRLAAIGTVSAGVAHEIKNPLAAIKGFSQLLAEGKSGPEEESEYIRTILKESNRLQSFLGQLLNYTRSRKLEIGEFDIGALVGETVSLVQERAAASRVLIECSFVPGQTVRADSEALKQVFLNLFLNGIQAMPDGGTLYISGSRRKDEFVIEVRDTGPGLPRGGEEDIFQPFYTSKNKGVGLGLAISRQIMEEHGGNLKAVNLDGKGASFIITLPGK